MAVDPDRSPLAQRGAMAAPAAPGEGAVQLVAAFVVGAALVSVAASNHEAISFQARLALAIAVLLAANWLGFRAITTPGRERVGEAWLVLASFALAAAGGVVSQRFHLGGDGGELWAIWGVAAGTMAWLARSKALGLLAAAALFGAFYATPEEHAWPLAWAFGLGLAPLAYVVRSPALSAAAGLGTFFALVAVASGDGLLMLVGLAAYPLGLLAWSSAHLACWPAAAASHAHVRLLAVVVMVGSLTLAAGHGFSSSCMSALSGPAVATIGAAVLASVVGWAWADSRLVDRALHRAMGGAAVVAVVVGIGTEPALDAMLAVGAIAAIGMMTAREGLVLRESGATFLGFGVIFMILLMADRYVDPSPWGTAFIFVVVGGLAVGTTWWLASRDGRRGRPGGEVTKGVDA